MVINLLKLTFKNDNSRIGIAKYDMKHLLKFYLCNYTPSIYGDGYIVFVFPFVCSFQSYVCPYFRHVHRICVKVLRISATTYQKAFIFGP